MASGLDDSSQTLYYSNINYNSGLVPKSSYIATDLESRFLFNQSNYQCSINKIKISSLEGIKIGTVPYQEWQFGLSMADPAGTPHYAEAYVSLPNETGQIIYYQQITFVDSSTFKINSYNYDGNNAPTLVLQFTPLGPLASNIYPNFAAYDSLNDIYWASDYANIYVYDNTGMLLTYHSLTNIVNAYFDSSTSNFFVCESYSASPSDNSVKIWNYVNSLITSVYVIRNNKAGAAIVGLQCVSSDGTTIIAGYNGNQITTYNAITFAAIDDDILDNVVFIQSIYVDTTDNSFVIIDNKLTPAIYVNTNVAGFPINLIDLSTNTTIINEAQLANSVFANTTATQYTFISVGRPPPVPGTPGFTNAYVQYVPQQITTITPATAFQSYTSGSMPYFICNYFIPQTGLQINFGATTTDASLNTPIILVAQTPAPAWVQIYQLPNSGPGTDYKVPPQVSVDMFGYVYLTFNDGDNTSTLRSNIPPAVSEVSPFLSFTGVSFEKVVFNYSAIAGDAIDGCDSITFDQWEPNVCYVSYETMIWTGFLVNDPTLGNLFMLRLYDWSQPFSNYLTIPPLLANTIGNVSRHIKSFELATSIPIVEIQTNDIILNLFKNKRDSLLYVSDSTTNQINIYQYTSLAVVSTQAAPVGKTLGSISGFITQSLVPPSQISTNVYNMQTFVDAFNTCLESIYTTLKTATPSIVIATAPYITLDYTTRKLTLNYDPNFSKSPNGIYVNDAMLRYVYFPTIAGDGIISTLNKYVLSPSGSITQSKETMFLLNNVDKLIIVSNMSLNGDYSGQIQSSVFTDLDFDTQVQFFNMDGNFIYSAILLRKYDMISNTSLRNISYQIFIQYKDESELPYVIPPGENISIKFEFDRLY